MHMKHSAQNLFKTKPCGLFFFGLNWGIIKPSMHSTLKPFSIYYLTNRTKGIVGLGLDLKWKDDVKLFLAIKICFWLAILADWPIRGQFFGGK